MYTVLRFINVKGDKEGDGRLIDLGKEVNEFHRGIYKGLDKVGGRFSVSVSEKDDWISHQKELIEFLKSIRPILIGIDHQLTTVEYDIAVEPEDLPGAFKTVNFAPELLEGISRNRVHLTITVYKEDAGHS